MTFTLPEPLASQFTRCVPARDRSRYVAEALSERLAARNRRLIESCDAANADPEVREIEHEFDALTDAEIEPWPARG
jgi:hypothetical protein